MSVTGILYVVATPIGNLNDLTPRALKILQEASLIAAEDTRHSGNLLHHLQIKAPLIALHDYNERQRSRELLLRVKAGATLAVISDAGTPLISDPGYFIVQQAHAMGIQVVPIPGACAAITALSAAGLPSDKFVFEGFLPAKSHARCQRLEVLKSETRTILFYESPHRILASIKDMVEIMGEQRNVVLARELTKLFETIHSTQLGHLMSWLQADHHRLKGEFVIVLAGAEAPIVSQVNTQALRVLTLLLNELPLKQAVALAVEITGIKKNVLYRLALEQ